MLKESRFWRHLRRSGLLQVRGKGKIKQHECIYESYYHDKIIQTINDHNFLNMRKTQVINTYKSQ
jgi:hypothetical protein